MANKTTSAKRNTTKTSASKKSTATKKQTTKKGTKPKTTGQNVTVEAEVVDVAKAEAIKEIFLWIFLAVCVLLFLSNLGIGGIVGNAVSSFFFGIFSTISSSALSPSPQATNIGNCLSKAYSYTGRAVPQK